jgi:5-methylcytosine-specific restriction endonuclease McrA
VTKRRKEGLLWECVHPAHVGNRMLPRGWFARNGRGEGARHAHCRGCRKEAFTAAAARRRGAGVTKIPAGWMKRLWVQQGGRCGICGLWLGWFGVHVDHKRPVSKGGRHEYANLQLTHKRCNLLASNKIK